MCFEKHKALYCSLLHRMSNYFDQCVPQKVRILYLFELMPWALIKCFAFLGGCLFEVGSNSRLGTKSNKYGNKHCFVKVLTILDFL